MVSAFVSRTFGMGLQLNKEELEQVNARRLSAKWSDYLSVQEAQDIYGTTKKKPITDELTLIRFFDLGVNEEGYWNFSHMALQIEDVLDILSVKYPNFDFLILMDQSSGHGKSLKEGLNALSMGVKYGGSQPKMRDTKIKEVGPYRRILNVGDVQKMVFTENDTGPFYLKNPSSRKYDRFTGHVKVLDKSKKMLLEEIKKTGFQVRGYYSRVELEKIAQEKHISLTYNHHVREEGWINKPKGLLQVLWERGYIDENKIGEYSEKGKKKHLDENGNVKKEYEIYVLRTLMERCSDFAEEKSAMEHLFHQLSLKGEPNLKMLTSPKYHCELAGEGVEYCWGMAKRRYRSIPLNKKKSKSQFDKCVRSCITYVKKKSVIKFSGKCRRYMLTYQNKKGTQMTYENIEKWMKQYKTHRNVADIEKSYIDKEYEAEICSQ